MGEVTNDTGTAIDLYYDTGSSNQGHLDTTNNYTTPADLGSATHSSDKFSIYATYTAGGGTVNPNHLMSLMGCGN